MKTRLTHIWALSFATLLAVALHTAHASSGGEHPWGFLSNFGQQSNKAWERYPIEGFVWPTSIKPGEPITFYVSVMSRDGQQDYDIQVFRIPDTSSTQVLWQSLNRSGQFFPLRDASGNPINPGDYSRKPVDYKTGCKSYWQNGAVIVPGSNTTSWQSGLYYARLKHLGTPDSLYYVPFVVRTAVPGSTSKILFKFELNTFHAYSYWGGGSLYSATQDTSLAVTDTIAIDRPIWWGFSEAMQWFITDFANLLAGYGYDMEYCNNIDADSLGAAFLRSYDMMVLWNHDEYWSSLERTATEAFKNQIPGKNIARFAPNTCYWRIWWEGQGSKYLKLKCNKDGGRPEYDLWRSTVNGAPGQPEAEFLGEQYQHGWNVVNEDSETEEPPDVMYKQHWIFNETQLAVGDTFGYGYLGAPDSLERRFRHGIVSGELDNLITGRAPFPIDTLAQRYVMSNVNNNHTLVLHQMVFFEDTLSNARVFAQGSGGWGSAIATIADHPADAEKVKIITKNIFDHFTGKKYIGSVWTDLIWSTTVQIDGTAYVKPGKTLTLSNNMVLTIDPGIALYVDGTLSIASNVTIQGGGTIVTRGSGVVNVAASATVTIPSGQSIVLGAGSNWRFGTNAKLLVNGALTAIGTSANRITFDRSGASNWYGIKIENSTATSNFDYCTLKYANYGLYLRYTSGQVTVNHARLTNNTMGFLAEYSSPFTLQNSTSSSNQYGVWVTSKASSSNNLIKNNLITSNTRHGVYLQQSAMAYFGYDTLASNTQDGLRCYSSTSPNLRGSNGHNWIHDNAWSGVYGSSQSLPFLGTNYQDALKDYYGYNHIYANTLYEVANYNSSGTIVAERDYWSASTTNCVFPDNLYGSIDYLPILPNTCEESAPAGEIIAYELELLERYDEAIVAYEKIIALDPNAAAAEFAVAGLVRCYEALKQSDEIPALLDKLAAEYPKTLTAWAADDQSLPYLIRTREFDTTLERASALREHHQKDTERFTWYTYMLASIHDSRAQDKSGPDLDSASSFYQDVLNQAPQSDWAFWAALRLQEFSIGGLGKGASPALSQEGISKDFTLQQNYPNPFNPTTQIRFTMPTDGEVALRIFDLRGQLVRELLHGHRAAGEYLTVWEGRSDAGHPVASGVYVLRLQSGRQVRSGKIMLLK